MSKYNPSIEMAFDKISNESLDSSKLFKTSKESFELRKKYNAKKIEPYCYECCQPLTLSSSKNDNMHFKHKPNHSPCLLTSNNITAEDLKEFRKLVHAKESERHKYIKNKIGGLLKITHGVKVDSVCIDDRVISINGEKRRPDVYCEYNDKKIVFEIQLSKLSLKYILNRYDFYKKNGFYLIWVIDQLNVHNQDILTKDIKYLYEHQNFFRLDEKADSQLKLECIYKEVFESTNEVHSKWKKRSVSLEELMFDTETFQAFYYNYSEYKKKIEQQILNTKKILLMQQKELRCSVVNEQRLKVDRIIHDIKKNKDENKSAYGPLSDKINRLTVDELALLNQTFESYHIALNKWIGAMQDKTKDEGQDNTVCFIIFILKTKKINININGLYENRSVFTMILQRESMILKDSLIELLFKRGYCLSEGDLKACSEYEKDSFKHYKTVLRCKFYNKLRDKSLIDGFYKFESLLCIIESIKQNKIVGFNYGPTAWLAFGNNLVNHHHKHWQYIEPLLTCSEVWQNIINSDKNGELRKKLQDLNNGSSVPNFSPNNILHDLYPELFLGKLTSSLN